MSLQRIEELTSSDYGGFMIGRFKEFYDDEQFSDFTITVENHEFKVSIRPRIYKVTYT